MTGKKQTPHRARFDADVDAAAVRILQRVKMNGKLTKECLAMTLDVMREVNDPFTTAVCKKVLAYAELEGLLD
jgi:hypothetical protein